MDNPSDNGGTPYLLIPRGRQGLAPISLNMTMIYKVERRIEEIRIANPASMPDLVTDFNLGFIQLGKMVASIQLELAEAKMSLNEAKAVVLLDKVERILAEKRISKSSVDIREAILALDPDVMNAQQRVHAIDACLTLLNNKLEAFEWAYQSVKKISDVQSRIPDIRPPVGYK